MRMIESVDSAVPRSSEDLWAEICSCLPHPEHKEAGDAFTDSFMDSYAEGSGSGGSSQPALKPWAPLNDSEVYLASLGECLPLLRCLVTVLFVRCQCCGQKVSQLFNTESDSCSSSAAVER